MPGGDPESDEAHNERAHADHHCQREHSPANGPEDVGLGVVPEIEVEGPAQAADGEFEEDQQDAPCGGMAAQGPRVIETAAVQERPGPGQQYERRGTEVGDPAGEVDRRIGAPRRDRGVNPHVVDRHQDHHRTAHDVDRRNPGSGFGHGSKVRSGLCRGNILGASGGSSGANGRTAPGGLRSRQAGGSVSGR